MSKASNQDQAAIAAFLTSRKVTRVVEGAGNGMTGRDWYKAVRGELSAPVDPTTVRRIAAYDRHNRAVIVNGLGELIAVE